jgi:hypothetical protein
LRNAATTLLLATAVGCGTSEVLDECRDPPSYASDVHPTIIEPKCLPCHAQDRMGERRLGAPEGLDFDRLELFAEEKDAVVDSITSGRQPPPGNQEGLSVNAVDRDLASRWRLCGYAP